MSRDVLIFTVARSATQSSGTDPWEVVALILSVGAAVVGILVGLQQIRIWVKRRRYDKAEDQVLELVQQQLDTKAIECEAAEYNDLRDSLRDQVTREVPREARRVFLRARLDALQTQIGTDVDEYQLLSTELAGLDSARQEPLDHALTAVIEASILPSYVRRQRTERWTRVALVSPLLFAISPIPTNDLVYGFFSYSAIPSMPGALTSR